MFCISWVQDGEVWALHVPLFHVCPKSACYSCVYRGWPTQFAIHFLLFSGSPFLYGLPYLGTGPCLTVGFAFLQPTLFPATISYNTTLSFLLRSCLPQSCWALWACRLFFSQRPTTAIGSFITSLAGSCVPFVFSWASLTHLLSLGFLSFFLNFAFSWAFTEFFGLPWPNYIIPHPWGLWARHQPLILCFHYFGPVVAHSRFFTSYTAHDLLFLSFRASLSPFTSSRPNCFFYLLGL